MKLIYTLAALMLTSLSAPAWADSGWDMTPQDTAVAQQFAEQQIAMTPAAASEGGMQFDNRAIDAQNAAAYAAYMQQVAYQQQLAHNQNQVAPHAISALTGNQHNPNLPVCQSALMSPGGLQATTLDSFVMNAGGNAELIYGDEGTTDIPPYFGFDSSHTINAGIQGNLTTGHASNLPGAWTTY